MWDLYLKGSAFIVTLNLTFLYLVYKISVHGWKNGWRVLNETSVRVYEIYEKPKLYSVGKLCIISTC